MPSCLISRSPFEFLTNFFGLWPHEVSIKKFQTVL